MTGTEKPRRSDQTKSAILGAARERFAGHGYERTTIRAVAADAGIDPSMVMRYFGSKEGLFEAALTIDLRLPDLTAVPAADLPRALVRHFLERWEGNPTDDALLVLLRSAVTNDQAAARMRDIFARQVAPPSPRPWPPRAPTPPAGRAWSPPSSSASPSPATCCACRPSPPSPRTRSRRLTPRRSPSSWGSAEPGG